MRKVPSLYYEAELRQVARRAEQYLQDKKTIIDIGGTKESDVHKFFSVVVRERIRNVNIVKTSETDLTMDAMDLKLKNASVDAILSFNTLEHVEDDDKAISEMRRILKRGGALFLTMPFLEAFHSYGGDYHRYTLMEMKKKFSWLDIKDCGACAFFGTAMAININHAIKNLFTSQRGQHISGALAAWLFFWLKYFDIVFKKRPNSWTTAATVYVMGIKK